MEQLPEFSSVTIFPLRVNGVLYVLRDARSLESDRVLDADICIVGAGAAGITIARELRESGLEVLVLEGGSDARDESHQALYEGLAEGQASSSQLTATRLRQFGGTTGHWAGWCRPLESSDFEARDWFPRSGWPLSRETLEPFYRRAVDYVQIGASEWDVRSVMERSNHPLLPLEGTSASSTFYQLSPPTRFGETYREDLADADNIDIYLHANVVHIALNANGDAVEHVECKTLEGDRFRAEADAFVLAMGGLENPRIMLASNDRRPNGIGNEHGHLGRYFMEHPHLYDQVLLVAREEADLSTYVGFQQARTFDRAHPGAPLAKTRVSFVVDEQVRRREQLQAMSLTIREDDIEGRGRELDPLDATRIRDALFPREEVSLFSTTIRAEQRPLRRSRVTLADETDPLGVPRLKLAWHVGEADFRSIERSLQHIGAALGELGIGRLWIPEETNRVWREHLKGGAHHMGTTRMSRRPEDGVVDPDSRVHGIDNLYIGGSSVYPTTGFANPTLTIVALALRLADHLEATETGGRT